MSEQPDDLDGTWVDQGDDAAEPGPTFERLEPTGLAAVDAVLDLLRDVHERPLDERVAVFEQAHAGLRHALDDPGTGVDGYAEPA